MQWPIGMKAIDNDEETNPPGTPCNGQLILILGRVEAEAHAMIKRLTLQEFLAMANRCSLSLDKSKWRPMMVMKGQTL